jgi:hypothetical protein
MTLLVLVAPELELLPTELLDELTMLVGEAVEVEDNEELAVRLEAVEPDEVVTGEELAVELLDTESTTVAVELLLTLPELLNELLTAPVLEVIAATEVEFEEVRADTEVVDSTDDDVDGEDTEEPTLELLITEITLVEELFDGTEEVIAPVEVDDEIPDELIDTEEDGLAVELLSTELITLLLDSEVVPTEVVVVGELVEELLLVMALCEVLPAWLESEEVAAMLELALVASLELLCTVLLLLLVAPELVELELLPTELSTLEEEPLGGVMMLVGEVVEVEDNEELAVTLEVVELEKVVTGEVEADSDPLEGKEELAVELLDTEPTTVAVELLLTLPELLDELLL